MWIKRGKSMLLLLMTLVFTSLMAMPAYANEDEKTVIKVGYALNYGTVKSPIVSGGEGYGYEYLTKIFQSISTEYTLEFVLCNWADVPTLLENGHIDLFGPVTYTQDNATHYQFPTLDFGTNFFFLSTLRENDVYAYGYDDIDGSTIAVQTGNPNEFRLHEFLEKEGWEAEIVYFDDADYEAVMASNDYDFCLISSLQTLTTLSPVVTIGSCPFYYVTALGNDQLISLIEQGMEQVQQDEYLFQEKLYLEYYDYSILSANRITSAEYSLIQNHGVFNIGIENFRGPVSSLDGEGVFQGIAPDVIQMLSEIGGFEYNLIDMDAYSEQTLSTMLDFSFISYDDTIWDSTIASSPYCQLPCYLIERVMSGDDAITNIGILSHYGITEVAEEGYLYGRAILEYTSALDMLDAYNNGQVDSIILTTATLNFLRDDFEDLNFTSTPMDMTLNLALSFSADYDSELIAIFNKLIAQLDQAAIDTTVIIHSVQDPDPYSFSTFMEENPLFLNVVIVFIIGFIALSEFVKRRAIYRQLNYDELTGLCTEHKFLQAVKKELSYGKNAEYSIISIDIDNFKYINELFGYNVGNIVLQKVATCVSKFSTNAICIARSNSDNFLLLLNRELSSDTWAVCSKDGIEHLEVLHPYIGETYNISFSIGVYNIKDPNLDVSFMIDCANIAREQGKHKATTTFYEFNSEMDTDRIIANDIVSNMVYGLEKEEFILQYQPKIHLKTGALVGAEVLVRWMKNGKLIPPNQFIPLFEKNGFIELVDLYVLERTCMFLEKHPHSPKLSVNLSGITLTTSNLVEHMQVVMETYHISASSIDVEITESAFVGDYHDILSKVEGLRALGLTISMDDFGVGISSLSRLKNLPLDTLKIDREFIIDALENHKGEQVLKNVINMAKDLQLETVAEGIETKKQEQLLENMGCDIGQGYYFARPLPEHEFIKLLNT